LGSTCRDTHDVIASRGQVRLATSYNAQ
jgi:hypothetical protein